MSIVINARELRMKLETVIGLVVSKNVQPIPSCIRLQTDTDKLYITATDLDIQGQTGCIASIISPVDLCVNGHALNNIVKKLDQNIDVRLEHENDTLHIKAGKGKYKLPTLPAIEFPIMAFASDTDDVVPFRASSEFFKRVGYAISREETRYYLNGVSLDTREGELYAVATDGHRLHSVSMPMPRNITHGVIVPRQTVALLPSDDLTVMVTKRKIAFEFGDTKIISKLIDGTFPEWRRVVHRHDNEVTVTVPQSEIKSLIAMIDRVSIMADLVGKMGTPGLKIIISPRGFEAQTHNGYDIIETLTADNEVGVTINPRLLMETLRSMQDDDLDVSISPTANAPIHFTAPNNHAVLMPLRD